MSDSIFQKATKSDAKLRMAISGPSGSGKTYSALNIGTRIADRVALLDTEHGSASKYADLFDFYTVAMGAPYHPDRFRNAIEAATEEGFDLFIIDSLSHAWKGEGGLLEIVDQIAKRKKSGNNFSAWGEATPIHRKLIEAIVSADMHIIATMRSKQEYVMEKDDDGRTKVQKKGMAPIQRDGMEYEFDVSAELDMDHNLIIQKTRCVELTDQVFHKPGAEVATILEDWLTGDEIEADDAKRAVAPTDTVSENGQEEADEQPVASNEQLGRLNEARKEAGTSKEFLRDLAENKFGTRDPKELTGPQAEELTQTLEESPDPEKEAELFG